MSGIDPRVEADGADRGDWLDWRYLAGRFGTTPDGLTDAQRRAVVASMRAMVRHLLWRGGTHREDGSPRAGGGLPPGPFQRRPAGQSPLTDGDDHAARRGDPDRLAGAGGGDAPTWTPAPSAGPLVLIHTANTVRIASSRIVPKALLLTTPARAERCPDGLDFGRREFCMLVGFTSRLQHCTALRGRRRAIRRGRAPSPANPATPTPRSPNAPGSGTATATPSNSSNCARRLYNPFNPKSRLKKNETEVRTVSASTRNVCGRKGSNRLPAGPAMLKPALWYG